MSSFNMKTVNQTQFKWWRDLKESSERQLKVLSAYDFIRIGQIKLIVSKIIQLTVDWIINGPQFGQGKLAQSLLIFKEEVKI